jgi:hypothetical protein
VISYCTSYDSHAFSFLIIFLFSFSSSEWSATTRGLLYASFVPYHRLGFEGLVDQLNNVLTPNDLQRRRAVNPLKIKIPGKNMREKPTNTPIIHSVY